MRFQSVIPDSHFNYLLCIVLNHTEMCFWSRLKFTVYLDIIQPLLCFLIGNNQNTASLSLTKGEGMAYQN